MRSGLPAMPNRDQDIARMMDKLNQADGIDVFSLPSGTIIYATTRNSTYRMLMTDNTGLVEVQGGRIFRQRERIRFSGSLVDGKVLHRGWIGQMMRMEFCRHGPDDVVRTGRVRKVRLVGDGWEWEPDWSDGPVGSA